MNNITKFLDFNPGHLVGSQCPGIWQEVFIDPRAARGWSQQELNET